MLTKTGAIEPLITPNTMKPITHHIAGLIEGMRVYLTLTQAQWDELAQIRKDNPKLSQWECRELMTSSQQEKE